MTHLTMVIKRGKIPASRTTQSAGNMLQCPRCNGRTEMKEVTGSYFRDGKKYEGTTVHKGICSACFRHGAEIPMSEALNYPLLFSTPPR